MLIDVSVQGCRPRRRHGGALGETMGHVGQPPPPGMVVPPALDPDISPLNVAKIMAYTQEVAGVLAASGALQDLYAVANGLSATTYDLGDAMAAVGINAVL